MNIEQLQKEVLNLQKENDLFDKIIKRKLDSLIEYVSLLQKVNEDLKCENELLKKQYAMECLIFKK